MMFVVLATHCFLIYYLLSHITVLLYDAYQSPLAQPRNVIGSYAVSSFLGVCVRLLCGVIGLERWTTGAISVGIAIIGEFE